jgi:hypothetical protein
LEALSDHMRYSHAIGTANAAVAVRCTVFANLLGIRIFFI